MGGDYGMIQKARQKDIGRILRYIGSSYKECPYLYMNLRKCGVNNPNVLVHLDEEDAGIRGVYLKYFGCLHFFTKEQDYRWPCLLSMVKQYDPRMIYMPKWAGEKVNEQLASAYGMDRMEVVSATALKCIDTGRVKRAMRSDIPQIADLLATDPAYKNPYDRKGELLQQYDNGYSRFYYIPQDGRIVSCSGTTAELDDMAIIGGLVTDPAYQGQGLGAMVTAKVWGEVLAEGKRGFSLIVNPVSKRLHERLGISPVGEVARFYKL